MAEIMHADAARKISDEHRNELNNMHCERFLKVIMHHITKAALAGKYELINPFARLRKDNPQDYPDFDVQRMLIRRLRELGYEYEEDIGEDGPNRPGHDELRWKR